MLDYIDAVFQACRELYDSEDHPAFDEITRDINEIFEQEGVGYRMIAERLVRWDDEVIHREAIAPAIRALDDERFGTAGAEFDEAAAAFGRGAYRDTLTHANAALESVLKVITGQSGTAGDLIKSARGQELIPSYLGRRKCREPRADHAWNSSRTRSAGQRPRARQRIGGG